ncbi:peptide chain release factor N(5)-glutamine methyltransferase [Clostridium cylindrosporum]|uniref:Release factor glutamine methyltransferase n=1 Tax=Clostridium cylindrosporum DSM 605 TaxID=1121307 RepID=A0A0J8DAC6_CLOCY|nr:peptide chain release factor N(5)-glutamine methyltransferase [Clostridium cylindrosporum]KMT22802.1 release factor glutamine methyltransferase PrmC [Clostridium cylindrosporum DSM 605]
MVKIYMAMKEGSDLLVGLSTSLLDSQLLLCHVLGVDRSYLFLNRESEISEDKYKEFLTLINLRKSGKPLQYITGFQEFMGLNFKVSEGVLIPRCDTEVLVENVIEIAKYIKSPVIVDVGCGSGAISVSLASFIKDSTVYALDIMDTPIKVTKENALLNNVEDRVNVLKSDMLCSVKDKKANIIVSNPPYIKRDVIKTLMTEVKDHEPMSALDGGEDGLIFYRAITKDSVGILSENGYLAYEIGHDQGEDVRDIMIHEGFKDVVVIKDLSGLDRVVIGHM